MSFEHRPPFFDLALPDFTERFGDLFGVRAELSEYEQNLIAGVMTERMHLDISPREARQWESTVRAAHYFLDRGALEDAKTVCQAFLRIINDASMAIDTTRRLRHEAEEVEAGDKRTRAYLALYKATYEGLMAVIAAPVVVGFAKYTRSNKTKEFVPKPDGRIDLRAIEKMENWILAPQNRLKEGLNNHVRNAYSHERYRLLDDDRVEMWDQNPRGVITWGPESWTHEQIEALCRQLWLTCLAIFAALALFSANYRKLIADRGWEPEGGIKAPRLRAHQVKQVVEAYADQNSLDVVEYKRTNDSIRLTLKTRFRGIDQVEEMFAGGDGWTQSFDRPVRYEEAQVAGIAIAVASRALVHLDDVNTFSLSFQNEKGIALGEFEITRQCLLNCHGPVAGNLEEDRQKAQLDTLGQATMWQRVESQMRPRTPRLRMPREPKDK